jgi:hypothetical protein
MRERVHAEGFGFVEFAALFTGVETKPPCEAELGAKVITERILILKQFFVRFARLL